MKDFGRSRHTKLLIALAIILCVGGAAAITLYSASFTPSRMTTPANIPLGLIGPQPMPTSYVSNLGGYIEDVGSDTLTISTTPLGTTTQPVVTTVTVGPDTAIFKEVPKDPAAFKKEQAAFKPQSPSSEPPLPYTPTPLTLSDLKTDMLVNIKLAPPVSEGATAHALEIGVLSVQPRQPLPSRSSQ
jgi:hypothetical protein